MRPSVSTLRGFFIGRHDSLRIFMLTKKIKVMKLIKLTSATDGKAIYVNVDCIGHFYQVPEKKEYGTTVKGTHTKLGITTHNNGGFEVAEDCNQIFKLIEKAK